MEAANHKNDQDADYYATQAKHVRQCLKEAYWAFGIWFVGGVVCLSIIFTQGFVPVDERPAEPVLMWGMPAWVVWGLFIPWFGTTIATWCFAVFILKDEEPYLEFPNAENETASTTSS